MRGEFALVNGRTHLDHRNERFRPRYCHRRSLCSVSVAFTDSIVEEPNSRTRPIAPFQYVARESLIKSWTCSVGPATSDP